MNVQRLGLELARDCPKGYTAESSLIHHPVGEGTPEEVRQEWAQWQRGLPSYFADKYPQKK